MIDNLHLQNFHNLPISVHDPYFSQSGYLPNHPREYSKTPPYRPFPDCFASHMHRELEVHWIVSGSMRVTINGNETVYHANDMVIINPFDNHAGDTDLTDGTLYYYFTIIDLSYFAQVLPFSAAKTVRDIYRGASRFCQKIDSAKLSVHTERISSLFCNLHDQYTQNQECRLLISVYELLNFLLTNAAIYPSDTKNNPDFAFVCQVVNLVETQYMTDLSTNIICDRLSWSKSYFCRRFHECFGMSFSEYLCRYRLDRAMQMHFDQNTSLTDIAAAVGFNNYTYFSRIFHKYKGISPKQYFCIAENTKERHTEKTDFSI